MHCRSIVLLAFVPLFAGACAYQGTPSTPVARNLTWFSYLNGDDMRPGCGPGAPDRYRMVYNGIYIEQVRSYDITVGTADHPGQMNSRVFGGSDLSSLSLSRPMDAFNPWRGRTSEKPLTSTEFDRLAEALQKDVAGQPLRGRLELASDDFYWVVAACIGGEFQFNAFRWPSPRFAELSFPDILFSWDGTGIPVNPPREVDFLRLYGTSTGPDRNSGQRFNIAAERGGLVGQIPFF